MVGEFANEPSEQRLGSWKLDLLKVRAAVPFVDAVMVVVPEERIVAVFPTVVERILDSLGERLGFRDSEHANSDDLVAEITAPISNDLDVAVCHPRPMVVSPSK